jgi:hypothetical protein
MKNNFEGNSNLVDQRLAPAQLDSYHQQFNNSSKPLSQRKGKVKVLTLCRKL